MTAAKKRGRAAMLDEATAGWPHAVVFIRSKETGAEYVRPAAFVFDTPGGFAWVEPQYIDPYGASSPALHIRQATIEPEGAGFRFDGPEWDGRIEEYEANPDQIEGVGYCLEQYDRWLAAEKKTAAQERAAVLAMIADDLAGLAEG